MYKGQHSSGMTLFKGETEDTIFTEKLRKSAYNDLRKKTKESLPELIKLTESGSTQARALLGAVSCGIWIQETSSGLISNYDDLYTKLTEAQTDEKYDIANAIATTMTGHNESLIGDGR